EPATRDRGHRRRAQRASEAGGSAVNDPDDVLVAQLRHLADQIQPVPELVATSARAALATRRLDGELAELVLDSAADTEATVRGAEGTRLVTFQTATLTVELQVREAAETLVMRGLVTGAAGEVLVESVRASRRVPIDHDGWFTVEDLRRGSTRLGFT